MVTTRDRIVTLRDSYNLEDDEQFDAYWQTVEPLYMKFHALRHRLDA